MNIRKKLFLIIISVFTFFILCNINSYAQTSSLNSLDYNFVVNPDGSINVVEIWNLSMNNSDLAYKDFYLNPEKYSGLTDIHVSKVEGTNEVALEYQDKFDVDQNCFSALNKEDDPFIFRIAWNISGLKGNKIYKIYYKLQNVVKLYNDCAVIDWVFLEKDNKLEGKNITGNIFLPKEVSNTNMLKVWIHGDESSKVEKITNDVIRFSLDEISNANNLEFRIVTTENIYESIPEPINPERKLEVILSEEKKLEDTTVAKIEKKKKIKEILNKIILFVNAILFIFFLLKIIKYLRKKKMFEKVFTYKEYNCEYYRKIPDDKNATPARALYLYNFRNKINIPLKKSIIFSATLLDFAVKRIIKFEPIDKKKIKITILDREKLYKVPEDERIIAGMLLRACPSSAYLANITTDDLEAYVKQDCDEIHYLVGKLDNAVRDYMISSNKIDPRRREADELYRLKHFIYMIGFIISVLVFPIMIFIPVLPIGLLICSILTFKLIKLTGLLSEKAYNEKKEWEGLIRYIENYAILKESTKFDMTLLEKYLVYATVFGISKQVLDEIKFVHPELFSTDYELKDEKYGFWNMVNTSFNGEDALRILNKKMEYIFRDADAAYIEAHSKIRNENEEWKKKGHKLF